MLYINIYIYSFLCGTSTPEQYLHIHIHIYPYHPGHMLPLQWQGPYDGKLSGQKTLKQATLGAEVEAQDWKENHGQVPGHRRGRTKQSSRNLKIPVKGRDGKQAEKLQDSRQIEGAPEDLVKLVDTRLEEAMQEELSAGIRREGQRHDGFT